MWLIILVIVLLAIVGPVMVGARVVGAQRTGFWICLGALIVSSIINWIALKMFHGLWFVSFFASGLGYMAVLDTTYLRGLAIALIQGVLMVVIFAVLAMTALGGMFHLRDLTNPGENVPAQSV